MLRMRQKRSHLALIKTTLDEEVSKSENDIIDGEWICFRWCKPWLEQIIVKLFERAQLAMTQLVSNEFYMTIIFTKFKDITILSPHKNWKTVQVKNIEFDQNNIIFLFYRRQVVSLLLQTAKRDEGSSSSSCSHFKFQFLCKFFFLILVVVE